MASHVIVIDSSARRATLKTVPEKLLSDVLREACEKLGRDLDCSELKYNEKRLDLSLSVRLSNLSSGAKIELVQTSRSPTVVSVALQIFEGEAESSVRLIEKFPNDTTLWMVLRKFESASSSPRRNLTGRGVPLLDSGKANSGRLYYETPVLHFMSRELSSFVDLQSTLRQAGLIRGNALFRLTFRRTSIYLEDAMAQISAYFSDETASSSDTPHGDPKAIQESIDSHEPPPEHKTKPQNEESLPLQEPMRPAYEPTNAPTTTYVVASGISDRSLKIFAPSVSSTPLAAKQAFNATDYEPTADHARLHQTRLAAAGTNTRLLSDAELQAKARDASQQYARIKEVEVKFRFPDQMQAVTKFTQEETTRDLFNFARNLMQYDKEPFLVRYNTAKGQTIVSPETEDVKLIQGLGLMSRTLMYIEWGAEASLEARTQPVLKPIYQTNAEKIEPSLSPDITNEVMDVASAVEQPKERKERTTGVPKWLKLPGRK